MLQLTKIRDVVTRKIPDAPHEVLLVLDGTTGQNAISQAKLFTEAINVTGIFLAKLDGTARGGIVIAIKDQLDIPVKFVGLGEKPTDIAEFDPQDFVEALFDTTD
jgi:fused signal recognition particle receptor